MFATLRRGLTAAAALLLASFVAPTTARSEEIWGRVCSTDPGADCGPEGCAVDLTYFLSPRMAAGPWKYGTDCWYPFTFPFTVTKVTAVSVTLTSPADLSAGSRIRYWGVAGSFEGLLLDSSGHTYEFDIPFDAIRVGDYDHANVVDPTPQLP